ncbi:ScbA/BarX family gamma-butyrolactone biosynthesis protein [Streptomyces sp. NPDC048680]|uniref:ScbA/BarX family gamma-butyrolactone biosynthesis protein n=1 Tax=Streptomyces sp. NPDC048680 TaxID=3155492 RepID=UPI0034182B90
MFRTIPAPRRHSDGQAQATGNRTGGSPPSSLTWPVPRQHVHRAAVAEVFLTGWRPLDDTRFALSAQWPSGHDFFTPVGGSYYDPMLVAETVRQAGALLAHGAFDVPLDHQFLMWELNYCVAAENMVMGSTAADLDIEVECVDIRQRKGQLTGLEYRAVARVHGSVAATGGARYTCVPPAVYERLRASAPHSLSTPAPSTRARVTPRSVGRSSAFDVVLAPTGQLGQWLLHADPRHPTLFDHPVDHVPGMVLLEAARQAAHTFEPTGCALLPTAVNSTYHRYVEHGSPCLIRATRNTATSAVHVTAHQDGDMVFEAEITVETAPQAAYCG